MSIQLKVLFLELDFIRECNRALFLISSLQRGGVAQRERERERWPFSETWVRTLPHLNSSTALQNNVSIIQQQPLIWSGVFFQSTFPLLADTCLHSDKAASPAAKHVYVFISNTKKPCRSSIFYVQNDIFLVCADENDTTWKGQLVLFLL